jgi:hypothetical protein
VVREWTNIVRAVGGPFISTNDAKYHIYVYADGMQEFTLLYWAGGASPKKVLKRVE